MVHHVFKMLVTGNEKIWRLTGLYPKNVVWLPESTLPGLQL
jgi:hypothetical protein